MSDVIRGHKMTDLEAQIMSWREEPLFLSQYTQQEVEEALREGIIRLHKWIDELAEKDKPLLDEILDQAFDEALKEKYLKEQENENNN